MNTAGAFVSYGIGKSNNSVANPLPVFSSGIKFGGRWILTHGSLISPLKAAQKILNNKKFGIDSKTSRNYAALPAVYVSYEDNNTDLVRSTAGVGDSLKNSSIDGRDVPNIVVATGKIRFLWKCELLTNIIDNLFTNWTIGHKQGDLQEQNETGKNFLPVFVLIDIGDPSGAPSVRDALTYLLELLNPVGPQRGEGVLLQGTPYGYEIFLNSLSRGLACNCLGEGPQLLLCDASTTLGFEGGPAYLEDKNGVSAGRLFGMTLNCLSWNRGEWVGLSLVGCLGPSLRHLLALPPVRTSVLHLSMPRELPVLAITEIIDSTIVLVRCGESWGSGIVVGDGYILTCAHVVQHHNKYGLSIFCKGKSGKAILIRKTPDNVAYDLALLHSGDFISSEALEFASEPAVKGEIVVAVGFPFFSEAHTDTLRATITKGCITNSFPHMLQTSCCVQSGCSGGAVLRLRLEPGGRSSCQLLGVIACNIIDENTNTKFPNVNMAIPTNVFRKTLSKFLQNPTSSVLKGLEETQPEVQSLWKLKISNSKL